MAEDNKIIAELIVNGVDKFKSELASTNAPIENLKTDVKEVGVEGSKSFDKLTDEVKKTGDEVEKTEKKTTSYKTQLKSMRQEILTLTIELNKMRDAGKQGTKEFNDLDSKIKSLTNDAGQLDDAISDVSGTIKNAGSDTRGLDRTLRVVQSVGAVFQLAQGAAALFGSENKELANALIKLNGIMAVTSSLQQIQEELNREDSVLLGIRTRAQRLYTFAVGETTAATYGLRLALFSIIGIGIIAGLIALIANFDKIKAAISGVNEELGDNLDLAEKNLETQRGLSHEYELQEKLAALRGESEVKILKTKLQNQQLELEAIKKVKEAQDEVTKATEESYAKRIANSNAFYNPFLLIAALFQKSAKDVTEQQKKSTDANNAYIDQQSAIANTLLSLKGEESDAFKDALANEIAHLEGRQIANRENAKKVYDIELDLIKKRTMLSKLDLDKNDFGKRFLLDQKAIKDSADAYTAYLKRIREEAKMLIDEIKPIGIVPDKNSEIAIRAQISLYEELRSNINITSKEYQLLSDIISDLNLRLTKVVPNPNPLEGLQKIKTNTAGNLTNVSDNFLLFLGIPPDKEFKSALEAKIAIAQSFFTKLNDFASNVSNIASQVISIRSSNELNELEEKRKKNIISEKEYQKESAKIKNEAAQKQRKIDIAMASAKVPMAILEALSSAPPPASYALAAVAGGLALAQVAILSASPLPKFKDGGSVEKRFKGSGFVFGKSHEKGGVNAELEGNEYVVKGNAVKKYGVKFFDEINSLKFNPVLSMPKKALTYHKKDTKMYEHMAIIASYLKQGYKEESKGNNILKEISSKINNKREYV